MTLATHLIRKLRLAKATFPVKFARFHTYCGVPVIECESATVFDEHTTCEACARAMVEERSRA